MDFFQNSQGFQGILAKSLEKWIFFQNFQGFQGILAKSFEKLANFPQKIHRKRK